MAAHPAVDRWLKNTIIEQAEKHLGVHVQLGKLERNIFLTRLTLTDVTLRDLKGSGNSISVSRLVVTVDPYAFFRGKVVIKDLKLEGMFLDIVRREDGTIAVDPLFPFWQPQPRTRGASARLGFEIENVAFFNVDLSYRDLQAGAQVKLDDVVIVLTRSRFDPPDRRTINLRAKKGDILWRVFPEGRTVSIDTLSAVFTVTPLELRVSKFEIATGPVMLEFSGVLPFVSRAAINGDLSIGVNIGKLPWLIPDSDGVVNLNGNVGGDLSSPSFRGQLGGQDVQMAGRAMNQVSADMYLDINGISLTDGRIEYRDEALFSEADVRFKRTLPFNMRIHTEEYPLHKILEEVGGKTDHTKGHVSADLMIDGRLSGGASTISMKGGLAVPLGDVFRNMNFDMSGRYEDNSLKDLLLTAAVDSTELVLRGTLAADGPMLDLSLIDKNLANWHDVRGFQDLSGSLVLNGAAKGNWENIKTNFDLEILDPTWNRFSGDLAQAHVDMDRTGLDVPKLTIKTGSSVLTGRGLIPFNGDEQRPWANVSVFDGRVEDLLKAAGLDLQVEGKLGGSVNLSSTRSGWEGKGRLKMQSGRILSEPFDEISLVVDFNGETVTATGITLVKDGNRLEGSGTLKGDKYQLSGQSKDPILLDGVRYLKKLRLPLGGEISLSGKVSGKLNGEDLRASTDVTWDQISYDGRPWGSGKGSFLFDGPEMEVTGELLDGDLSAFAVVDLRGEFPFSGTISTPSTIDSMGLNDLLGLRIPGDIVSGNISVWADASGILADINKTHVDGIINDADFTINGIHFNSQEQVPFEYYPETGIRFVRMPLRSGGSVINGTLRIAPDAGLEGNVEGSIDLEGLTFLEPTVDTFSGQAVSALQVTGSLSEPVLNGTIELSGTECVAHLPFDFPVNDLKGKLEIVGNRLHIVEIIGKPASGTLSMSGELFMNGFKPVQGSLVWKGEAVPIQFPEGLDTINRADLGLKFSEGRGFLRGTINMDQGTYTRNVDIDNLIALLGEGNTKIDTGRNEDREGSGGEWLNLDVEMITASPLQVDIKLVRGEASGNLHLRGTAAAPILTGRLEMTEGTIEYRDHVFEVTAGTVGFLNPKQIEPSFDFSGRTEVTGFDREGVVTDYTVELLASGVPEKFKLDLVSSPALSEADIVSLLIFGAVGEQAFASRAGLSATEATLLLTRELKGKLETEVERVTGFDRFTINPSAISSTGERTTRIQVDKKLSEKFYLTYSTPILASEEQEVQVKYRITRSLSLVGEQLGERDYGLDLDLQFEIR